MAVVVFVAPLASVAREMDIYFGSGNFAHLQHEFVMKEALDLSRRAGDITSVTGYAGGKQVGELDRICYSGLGGSPDYASLGHAQVVRLTLPDSSIQDFAQLYFTEVPKRKTFEVGAQFRSLIGLRGGMKSPFFPLIEKANGEGLKLLPGEGNDPDTAGKDVVVCLRYEEISIQTRGARKPVCQQPS
eukprot:CAMPEP_0179093598 /NCGR_PEP_ID=MMETSP0796-20121207/42876_1 /TAXON_ID=73915 /ORGANISM="Pyrodinium bahamense, Strain pbaha01" /LENGTH=186 /DNA_ID=CAMNT_0020791241 /DNA_START=399 /DNA_END=959 /DNA_ORIENTATION=-